MQSTQFMAIDEREDERAPPDTVDLLGYIGVARFAACGARRRLLPTPAGSGFGKKVVLEFLEGASKKRQPDYGLRTAVDKYSKTTRSSHLLSVVWFVSFLAASFLFGCIRDIPELPPPWEGGFITGMVAERTLATGELEARAGVRVRVRGWSGSAVTDADGRFVLSRLTLGEKLVWAERRADDGSVEAAQYRRVEITADGQSQDLGRWVLSLDSVLDGAVLFEGGEEARGALVALPGTPYQGVSSGSGFSIPQLPPGLFDVSAFYPGWAPATRSGVHVGPGTRETVSDLVLTAAGTVSTTVASTVLLSDSVDAAGTEVRFESLLSETVRATETAEGGAYALAVVPGLYRVVFEREGYVGLEAENVVVFDQGTRGLDPVVLIPVLPVDGDGDGQEDALDSDLDNDGCPNESDLEPDNPFVCGDADNDGIPDGRDLDADNDTLTDAEERSPGLDGFVTNPLSADTDNDGLDDAADPCPVVVGTDCGPGGPAPTPGGPVVERIVPNPAALGVQVRLMGRNLASPAGAVRIQFTGSSTPVAPDRVSETEIAVTVPNDAVSGPLEIQHPSGPVNLPRELILDENAVIAESLFPLYLRAGEEGIELRGRNLDRVTALNLPDGTEATNVRADASSVLFFDVPASFEAVAGPLTLAHESGSLSTGFGAGAVRTSTAIEWPYGPPVGGRRDEFWSTTSGELWQLSLGSETGRLRSRVANFTTLIPGTDLAVVSSANSQGGTGSTSHTVIDLNSSEPLLNCGATAAFGPTLIQAAARLDGAMGVALVVVDSGALRVLAMDVGTRSCNEFGVSFTSPPSDRWASVIGTEFVGDDLFILGGTTTESGWVLMNVAPDDGVEDVDVDRQVLLGGSGFRGSGAIVEPRSEGRFQILTSSGLYLSGTDGHSLVMPLSAQSTLPSHRLGRELAVKDVRGRGGQLACAVLDLTTGSIVAELIADFAAGVTGGFQCAGSGMSDVVALYGFVGAAYQIQLMQLLTPP